MKEILEAISTVMEEFNENATKRVEKGNASAGAKSRKSSLVIAKLMKDWRAASVKKD